jgi:alpha-galactosidase
MKKIISIVIAAAALTAVAAKKKCDVQIGDWAIDGKCDVRSYNSEDWKLYAEALPSDTEGVSFLRVRLTSDKMVKRPLVTVTVRIPGGEARSLWRPSCGFRRHDRAGVLPFFAHSKFVSCAAQWMPLYAFLDTSDINLLTVASSQSRDRIVFRGGTEEGPNTLIAEYTFNTSDAEAPTNNFEVTIRFDVRRQRADRIIPKASAWMRAVDTAKDYPVPELSFEPLWSSWCAYHHGITEEIIEREAAVARSVGLNTIIVDDGWQVPAGTWVHNGENLPKERYSKDFAAHIKRVQDAGTKYILWYPVTPVSDNIQNFKDYDGKLLYRRSWGPYVWDPRFADRRKFFHDRITTAIRDWKVDGLKLDFIDSWSPDYDQVTIPKLQGLAGRDMEDLMPAVEKAMTTAREIISQYRPDAVIEFRQCYMGPTMLKCCTQVRVQDCPGSLAEMRIGIANLRLTSGANAVHSDPIQWAKDASTTSVAESIIASIFGIGQYSVRLTESTSEQLKVLKHYVSFIREHSNTLYHGDFQVQGLSTDASVLVGETASERIIGAYKKDFVTDCGKPDRRIILLNCTGVKNLVVRFGAETKGKVYDVDGTYLNDISLSAGLSEIVLPRGGYLLTDR